MLSMPAPCLVPIIQARKLDPQEGCLESVQPLVVAQFNVLPFAPLSQVAQSTQTNRKRVIVGAYGPPITERSQVLARIERESCSGTERPRLMATVSGTMRLGRVFKDQKSTRLSERLNRRHLADLAVEMNREDRRCSGPHRCARRTGVYQPRAVLNIA